MTTSSREVRRTLEDLKLPLAVGVLAFTFILVARPREGVLNDFDYFWHAGRAVWYGRDPYLEVRTVSGGTPFYYPGTAAVVMAPFGALPNYLAAALFAGLSFGLLTSSLDGWRRWIVVSAPALHALVYGQWSPWLTAGVGLSWLSFVWAVKPSIGLPLCAGWISRRAVIGGAGLLLLSLLILPHWPVDWLAAVQATPQYKAPIQRPGGFLLLLAFLRWRTPEARFLGLLALVPHTTGLYEQLPLLLIPRTKRALAVMMGLSYVGIIPAYIFTPGPEKAGSLPELVADMLDAQWAAYFALVYLPALLLVLFESRRVETGSQPGQAAQPI